MEKKDFLELLNSMNINEDQLMSLALEEEFIKRIRLIKPLDILHAICIESINGTTSFNDIASHMQAADGPTITPQAVCKKMTDECVSFFKKILSLIIMAKINNAEIEVLKQAGRFTRILVQDSTIIRLPSRLFSVFSGVANQFSSVSNARIQGVYDLISESFISFSIDPYSKNDCLAAGDLCLQIGDLTLRDRGYLIMDEIKRHVDAGANCIYRYRNGMILSDIESGQPIDILKKLKKGKKMDMNVMLNNEERTVVRIVASPIKIETANRRRCKAKIENKNTLTEEYLELLSWSIYITTISKEDEDYISIFKIYSLRWRIEIIFKCWKSNMSFDKIHNVSQLQLSVVLYARFIMILICSQLIFQPCRLIIKKHLQKSLSMVKLTKYLIKNPSKIMKLLKVIKEYSGKAENLIVSLSIYCCYNKRKRKNFEQEREMALFSLS